MVGLPYAYANDDGSVTCPICGIKCGGMDESQRTAEDAFTKGGIKVYQRHYAKTHAKVSQ